MFEPLSVSEVEAGIKKIKERHKGPFPENTDPGKMIPMIVKDIDAGRTVKQIAARHKIPERLAEEITRMYLTHPGIDTVGIRRRIEG